LKNFFECSIKDEVFTSSCRSSGGSISADWSVFSILTP